MNEEVSMTEGELEVLKILNEVSPRAAKSVFIREKLGIAKSQKNAKTVLQRLGKLRVKGLVRDYKPDPCGDKKYWAITEAGKQALQHQ